MKIADEISLGTVSDKLNYLLSNIENIKIVDSLDKEVETLSNHIKLEEKR